MKVTIVGYTHLTGESKKTGNAYNFYSLHLTYQGERGFTGLRVKEVSVSPEFVSGIERVKLPIVADLAVDFSGRIQGVNFT